MKASGLYKKHKNFSSFIPYGINRDFPIKDTSIYLYTEKAVLYLGEINSLSYSVTDTDFFLYMFETEGDTIGKIVEEIMKKEPEINPEKRNLRVDIFSYIKALNFAVSYLKKSPLSMELLKKLHSILVHNPKKFPGEFRKKFTWCAGETIDKALFVPPPAGEIGELIFDLEKFWHNKNLNIPELIKIALTHYQFITIHPFMDGNGRVARLLVTLQLLSSGILKKPLLYYTEFQKRYRKEFKKSLYLAHETGDVEQRVKFFILGMIETAKKRINTLKKFIKVKEKYENRILSLGRRGLPAKKLIIKLFSNPVTDIKSISKTSGMNYRASYRLTKELEELGILQKMPKKIFILREYIELFLKSRENGIL